MADAAGTKHVAFGMTFRRRTTWDMGDTTFSLRKLFERLLHARVALHGFLTPHRLAGPLQRRQPGRSVCMHRV